MSDEKDSREDKLPQWARRELDRLRSNVEYHQKQLQTLVERPDGVMVRDPYGDSIPVAGEREILRVALPDRSYVDIRWMSDGYLEVSTFESLTVQPVSSNLVRLRPTTWQGVSTL